MIKMKSLDNDFCCPTQCYMNVVLFNEVPEFLALIPSKTTYALQKKKSLVFDTTHPIIS